MFKRINKIFLPPLTSSGKLKQKIWGISVALLLPSLLVINVINVRTASNHNWISLLIKNIYWIIPWGLAYLIASRHRELLKVFTPLYLSLTLLITSVSFAFKSQNLKENVEKEFANILKDYKDFLEGKESSYQNQVSTYSPEEYGHFAVYLNKFKKTMELSKQEIITFDKMLNEIEINKIFTDEVLFNFLNIIDKKKKLEHLLVFLDESSKKTEDMHTEFATWMLSSPDVDEVSRKNFADAYYREAEEKKFLRQESYRIKRNIVQAYVKLLDFLSKTYGYYAKGEDMQIEFTNEKDLQACRFICEMIAKLREEEENFTKIFQENLKNITNLKS